jgi:hypothetical protein
MPEIEDLDCYFYHNEEKRKVRPVCVECHDYKLEGKLRGWFWEGSKQGYGPWDFTCDFCKKVIHGKKET